MADWLDDPELYKTTKAPKSSGGDDWLDDPSLYAAAPDVKVDLGKVLGSTASLNRRNEQIASNWEALTGSRAAPVLGLDRVGPAPAVAYDELGAYIPTGAAGSVRPDRSLSALGSDLSTTFKGAAREGVTSLLKAPVSGINAINAGANWAASDLARTFGQVISPEDQIRMASQPEWLRNLDSATHGLNQGEYQRSASGALRYDDENAPSDLRGSIKYTMQNPGSLLTDVSRTAGSMLPTVIPGATGLSIGLQATQQAQQTADQVEQNLLRKGVDVQTAKAEASKAFATAAGIGAVAPRLFEGGQAFEKLLTGTATRGTGTAASRIGVPLLGEIGSEVAEETGIQLTQNNYSRDPLTQGLGAAGFKAAVLGAGMGAIPAGVEAANIGQERLASRPGFGQVPDNTARTPEDIASAEIETALDEETFANRPAPPVAPRPTLGEALAPEAVADPPVAAPDADAPFRRPVEAPVVEAAAVAPTSTPAPILTVEKEDTGSGKSKTNYTTEQRSDGSHSLVREVVFDDGETFTSYLGSDGTWKKGKPARTAGNGGAFAANDFTPQSFESPEKALSEARDDAGVSEPVADSTPVSERLYSDYNPEASQQVTRVDGNLSFPESRLTRRALDDALSDPNPVNAAERLLRNIAEQPDIREEQKWLAEKLAPMMKPLGVKLVEPNPDLPYAGAYNNVDNTVWARQADPETVLHEVSHGVTSALATDASARANPVVAKAQDEFQSMLSHLQTGIGMGEISTAGAHPEIQRLINDRQGPLSNVKELIAYGVTNRPFQDFLKSLPPPPGREQARNMWEYFKSVVTSLFGAKTDAQRSYLDALLESAGDLIEFAGENPQAVRKAQQSAAARLRPVSEMGNTPAPKPAAVTPPASTPPKPPVAAQPSARPSSPAPRVTGTKNEFVDGERERRGEKPIERDAPRPDRTANDMAQDALSENPDLPDEIIARVQTGNPSLTSIERLVLLNESTRLRTQRENLERKLANPELSDVARAKAQAELDAVNESIFAMDSLTVTAGRDWGREGRAMQQMMKEDFTLAALERRESARKGEALTAEERAELKTMAGAIAETQKRLEAAQKRLEEYESGAAVAATYKRLLDDMRSRAREKPDLPALKKRADAAKAALRELAGTDAAVMMDAATLSPQQALIDLGAYHYANGAQTVESWTKAMEADVPEQFRAGMADLFELSKAGAAKPVLDGPLTHKQVYDLALALVRSGVKGENAVMAGVTAEIKKTHPETTERDVRRLFSDYGKAYFPSKDADKAALRELRALVQMQESIDRLTEGLPKLKNGLQRDKATLDVIAKRKQLNDMLRAATKKATDAQRKAALEAARVENLRKQIELIDQQIFTGEREAKAAAKPVSVEVARLTALRDLLTKERQAIDNPPKSEQQKREEARVRALESSIQDMRDTLAGKPGDPAKPIATNEQIKSLEKLRDELRAQLDAAKAAKNPPMSDAEKQQRRVESGLKRRIKNIEELLLFGKKPKPTAVEKGEAALLLESALQAFTDIRDAINLRDNPPLTADERYQKSRATSLARELKKIQERIDAGDYEKTVRIPKELNEANTKAAYAVQQAKEVFLRHQFEAEMARRSPLRKILGGAQEALNLARAVMTSFDLSAVLRQGGFISLGNPVRAAKAFMPMLRAFASKEGEFKVKHDIETDPLYALSKSAGLELTDTGSGLNLSKLEEAFMSRWIEHIPKAVGGGFLRGSQRAFTTFLNKLRFDSFKAMTNALARDGSNPSMVEAKAIASYINVATGRGKIGLSANAATGLNTVFFAPKLVASRFNLLAGQPLYGGTAKTRRLVLQEYARFLTGVSVVIGLGAMAADPDDDDKPFIGLDPRSTDFLKMRFGKTYIDPMAGLSQVTVFLARELSGESLTGSGAVVPLREKYRIANLWREEPLTDKPGYGGQNAYDVAARFVRTKLAPIPGAIVNLFTGEDVVGNEVSPQQSVTSLVVPLSMQNVKDVMSEHGVPAGMAITTLELLGMGVQYRDPAQLKAPDYADQSRAEKNSYSAYLKEANKVKQAKTDLQDFANKLPEDMPAGDIKYEVEKKAAELGLEGATVDIYKRNTTARDPDTGARMRGVKRSETGSVRMNWKEAYSLSGFSAVEKKVSSVDEDIEALSEDDVTNEELEKIHGKYVFTPLTNGGDEQASKKDIETVLSRLRFERKFSQDQLTGAGSE